MRHCLLAFACCLVAATGPAHAQILPTGQSITPLAAPGARFTALDPGLPGLAGEVAGQPAALALSPDGRTLVVLTSGYNRTYGADGKAIPALSNEYAFVYDVRAAEPRLVQAVPLPNALWGVAWSPAGDRFWVAGGVDDAVIEVGRTGDRWEETRRLALGHKAGLGLQTKPAASAVAVSPDGTRLLVANYENDSVSLIALGGWQVLGERDLRAGPNGMMQMKTDGGGHYSLDQGKLGGTYPRAVAWASDTRAYVASQRDREVIALGLTENRFQVLSRTRLPGQPVALLARGNRLYAALDNTDRLATIDTRTNRVIETVPTVAPSAILADAGWLGGAGSNALALSADGATMFVSNGGQNAIAVVALSRAARGLAPARALRGKPSDDAPRPERSAVIGLIPTGWYPDAVAAQPGRLFVANAKSLPGPNPLGCRNQRGAPADKGACVGANQYVWQLEKGGLTTIPLPSPATLGRLTRQVAVNNRYPGTAGAAHADATMAFLRAHIRHVLYIVKENRSYDQVLGDLGRGNGDPKLTLLGEAYSPNHHALAREFVDLDWFEDAGESSNTGWNWTTAARTTDYTERNAPVNYADRGLTYDAEGDNRNVNVGLAGAARLASNPLTPPDPDLLAGTADVAAPDGPGGATGEGYLWNAALRAGKSIRNYGFYGDLSRYFVPAITGQRVPILREPFKAGTPVFFPAKAALAPVTDIYYRGFDLGLPDYWRFKEWEREFDGYAARGDLPALSLIRLPNDHFGNFASGTDGVNTVETQMGDNDYALGRIVEKVAASKYAHDTLIFVIEDDAQDGPDHVSAHRSIAFVAGPWVRRGAVVHAHYTTVNMVRTIEDVLGLAPMGLNDAMAAPMSALFSPRTGAAWSYRARVPGALRTTALPLPAAAVASAACRPQQRTAAWWQAAMRGQDFRTEDRLDTPAFNRALARGLRGHGGCVRG